MAKRRVVLIDGYVRVSRVGGRSGQRFISPAVQREQIAGWARMRGARVARVFEELDESGARADRPLLTRALERVEAGHTGGLVVARLDRFGRSLVDSLVAIERIQRAGGVFVSVQDGLDLTTDTGRMILRVMLSMAEWELDRIRSSWDASRERAVARGQHLSPKPPTGYRRSASGRLVPQQPDAGAVADVFRRRAAGEPISALCRVLEAEGVATPYGNQHWRYTSLRGVLRNRVYLGEARSGTFVKQGAHEPLVDELTWQRAQRPRHPTSVRASAPSLLAGLVRCAGCSMAMSSCRGKDDHEGRPRRQYMCSRHFAGGACPAPASISAFQLEPFVEDAMFELLSRRGRPRTAELASAQLKLDSARQALGAYRDNPSLQATLGDTDFRAGLEVRRTRVDRALLAVDRAQARQGIAELAPVAQLEAAWPAMTLAERRQILAQVVDCVFVSRGRRRVAEGVAVLPAGSAPADLPRAGDKHARVQSLDVTALIASQGRRSEPVAWSRSRIERELRRFTRGRANWPPPAAFHDAGRARLLAQVELQGGEAWWANRLGLRPPSDPARRKWTEQRLRSTLAAYLADKRVWPTVAEFRADGMGPLRAALRRNGGVDRWAAEFALPRHHRHNGPDGYWTDKRIRTELARICQGRTTFPGRKHLARLGLAGMVRAMCRGPGLDAWAHDFGLPRQPRGGIRGPRNHPA